MGTENEHEHEDTVDGIPAVRRWPWPAQPPTSTEPPKPPRNYQRLRTAGMIGLWLVVFVGVGFLGDLASNNAPVTAFRHLIEPKASVEVQSKCSSCSKPHRSASVIATQPTFITGLLPSTAPVPTPTQPPRPAATSPSVSPSSTPPSLDCYPTTASGGCYLPGEYCPDTYHNSTGVTAAGEVIVCVNNDGWRWEPYPWGGSGGGSGTSSSSGTPPQTCPPPETGTPGDCVSPTCPPPSTGTPPVCVTQTPPQTCPPPETGTPPECATPPPVVSSSPPPSPSPTRELGEARWD
jgi:hypothetical protein